jgi:hypothetical protein
MSKISILFRVSMVTSMKWITVTWKLLKNWALTFCCPLSKLSYVPLKNHKFDLETKMHIFDVLTYRIRTPDIFIHFIVYHSNGLIVADNLNLSNTFGGFMAKIYTQMYISVRRTLLGMQFDHIMPNIKLGSPVSLSNCLNWKAVYSWYNQSCKCITDWLTLHKTNSQNFSP